MTLRILSLALEILIDRRNALIGAILLPAVLLVFVDTIGRGIAGSTIGWLVYISMQLVAYSWLAISIHRIVLLNDAPRLHWGWRESRFTGLLVLTLLGIGLVIGAVITAFESIGMPSRGFAAGTFQFIVYVLVLYWAAQYFLIFPAIAVDHKYSIKHSAVDTEDRRVTTFMVVAVFPALLSLVELPASMVSNVVLFLFIHSVLSIVGFTLGVAMLSVLYRELASNDS